MEEYGIMELFRADSNQMRAVDGKQRIYLEWPNQCISMHALSIDTVLTSHKMTLANPDIC